MADNADVSGSADERLELATTNTQALRLRGREQRPAEGAPQRETVMASLACLAWSAPTQATAGCRLGHLVLVNRDHAVRVGLLPHAF